MTKKNRIIIGMVILCLGVILSGCTAGTKTEDVITLSVMDPCKTDPDVPNARYDVFCDLNDAWATAHPTIQLEEKRVRGNEYWSEISNLATIGKLPDVFIISANQAKLWVDNGFILDVTDAVTAQTDAGVLDAGIVAPLTFDGKNYGFPVFGSEYHVVLYDKAVWAAAGCEAFPSTWSALADAAEKVKAAGYDDAVAVDSGIATTLINALMAEDCDDAWFDHLVARDQQALFVDDDFEQVLRDFKTIADSECIAVKDVTASSAAADRLFIDGKTPAVITTANGVNIIENTLKAQDPERYEQIGVALLPTVRATTAPRICIGTDAALVINASVTEDPAKLAACLDYCEALAGEACAEKTAGLSDALTEKTAECLATARPARTYTHYMLSDIWYACTTSIEELLKDKATPADVANQVQDIYEEYY